MSRFVLRLEAGRLDLPLCVGCGQVFRWARPSERPGQWIGADGDHWYRVRIVPDAKVTHLEVETNADQGAFERLFHLERDEADELEAILAIEPRLAPYVAALPGLRLMRPTDPVETAMSFLCTPNNHLVRIVRMVGSLASYGGTFDGGPDGLCRFPDLATIAGLPEEELRAKGFGYRARTIPNVAHQMLERGGAAWLDGLKLAPYGEAHAALVRLDGVGPKLADCICLFALHHEEAVPVDTHLWQAARRLYFPDWRGRALTERRYRAVGNAFRERFGRRAGWAHQYLFYENLLNWRTRRNESDVA